MKIYSITFSTFLCALRHWWKTILVSTILFTVLGLAAGFLFSGREEAAPNGAAEALPALTFDLITRDRSYYDTCCSNLNTSYNQANAYATALLNDSSLSEAQKEIMQDVQKSLQNFSKETLQPLDTMRSLPYTVIIPEELLDAQLLSYQRDLEDVRLRLISAEAAVELLQTMDAPVVANDQISASYLSLIQEAAAYGPLLKQEIMYKGYIDRLENDYDNVRDTIRRFDSALNAAVEKLNKLQNSLVENANQICLENTLLLKLDPEQTGTIAPGINHGHVSSTSSEAFAIIVLFTTLVGLCSSCFWAVCKEAKHKTLLEEKAQAEE